LINTVTVCDQQLETFEYISKFYFLQQRTASTTLDIAAWTDGLVNKLGDSDFWVVW
jgi:hypothetical protein